MSPLPPPPPSARPPQQAPRRKTSIRTVPKAMQKQFLDRVRSLKADPLQVLPECPHGTPKPIAKVQSRLARFAKGKPGFLDKRDKGIVGAVAQAWTIAGWNEAPRMLDAKVGGQRKFFVQRGQVERTCSLGVQNHDHAPSLLMAYRTMAKEHGLHFFAQPRLWCTGDAPRPPAEWLDALQERTKVPLQPDGDDHTCGHDEDAQVCLGFRGGPTIRVCARCGKKAGQYHMVLTARYAGPRQRKAVEIHVRAPDGQMLDPPNEDVAAYRGGIRTEQELIQATLADWKPEGTVWLAEGHVHRSIDAWLNALGAEPWERTALAAMAPDGYTGDAAAVAGVLTDLRDRLPAGVSALLADGADAWLAQHQDMAVRDILRGAHEESRRRTASGRLPPVDTGPIGSFLDDVARAKVADGRSAAVAVVRRATEAGSIPGLHLWAVLEALGGDLGLQSRIGESQREPASALVPLAAAVLESEGDAYLDALRIYLRESGSGETA